MLPLYNAIIAIIVYCSRKGRNSAMLPLCKAIIVIIVHCCRKGRNCAMLPLYKAIMVIIVHCCRKGRNSAMLPLYKAIMVINVHCCHRSEGLRGGEVSAAGVGSRARHDGRLRLLHQATEHVGGGSDVGGSVGVVTVGITYGVAVVGVWRWWCGCGGGVVPVWL